MRGDHWYDERGVWSGSATLLEDGSPVLLYTGESRNMTQVQNMAIPADKSDPLLLHWVKVSRTMNIFDTSRRAVFKTGICRDLSLSPCTFFWVEM